MPKSKIPFDEFVMKMNRVSQIDFARLAAFIDGEGHIGISVSQPRGRGVTRRHTLIMTVTNTCPLLFDWLTSTFGGIAIQANKNHMKPNTKLCFRWLLNELQCEEIVRRCLPYLIIKTEQARIALALRDMLKDRNLTYGRSHRVEPELLAQRDGLHQQIMALNSGKGFGRSRKLKLVQSEQAS